MIKFHCSSCGKKLGVPDEYAGRRIRCPKCEKPSIVPAATAESETFSMTEVTKSASSAVSDKSPARIELQRTPVETSAKIELQPRPMQQTYEEVPENPNIEALRQFRSQQESARQILKSSVPKESSPLFERFGPLGFILNPIIRVVGSFPLAILASIAASAAAIAAWNLIAVAVGMPLEVFYLVVPVAAGIGLCLISDHRGLMMGLLSLLMGALAMVAGRMTQVHLFIFPEWNRIVAAADIPADRQKFYLALNHLAGRQGTAAARQEIAEQDTAMPTIAICTLIQDKQLEPELGLELYFAMQSQLEKSTRPLAEKAAQLTFPQPPLQQAWTGVAELLGQWDAPDKRLEAVKTAHLRYLFFMEQTEYKMLLDDYPRAMTIGFFMCDGCVFLFLRVVYWIIGLIGAYKTCSVSFMD